MKQNIVTYSSEGRAGRESGRPEGRQGPGKNSGQTREGAGKSPGEGQLRGPGECIAWLLLGQAGLAAFETARTEIDRYGYRIDTFFESGTRNGDIPLLKEGVQGWIQQLKEHPS